ncbi:MAG: flagellar export chaperone FliS [Pedosphaera sp.]|nr:flagellar export chaperone FliS [Pedosphaera sp.]
MIRSNPWQSYRQVATKTASPGQLVLMLFDGAIRFLDRAGTGFTLDDPVEFNETIGNNVIKAQAIIAELSQALDMKRGGEFSVTMRQLYNYMDGRLNESNIQKEPVGIKDTLHRLTVLRDAWQQMLQHGGQPVPGVQPVLAPA